MFRGLIFDLDGTLADTLCTIGKAVNEALQSLGLPQHPLDSYRYFVGDGVTMLCRRVLPVDRMALLPELEKAVRRQYDLFPLRDTRLIDGMEALLIALKGRGVRLGVLSNKPHPLTLRTLEGLGIDRFFVAVLGQTEDLPTKPDPAGVERLLMELKLPKSKVGYVGDTSTDMQTAVNSGLISIGVLWGFRPREELIAHGARHLVSHPLEILDLVGEDDERPDGSLP